MLAMSERETGAESASAGAETEVTPEMVEAGLSALYEYESACLLGLPLGEMLVERVLEAAFNDDASSPDAPKLPARRSRRREVSRKVL